MKSNLSAMTKENRQKIERKKVRKKERKKERKNKREKKRYAESEQVNES